MKTPAKKKVTLMIDADVYEGLRQKVGGRGMGEFMSQLARPHVVSSVLIESYKAQAADKKNSAESSEWVDDEIIAPNVWQL